LRWNPGAQTEICVNSVCDLEGIVSWRSCDLGNEARPRSWGCWRKILEWVKQAWLLLHTNQVRKQMDGNMCEVWTWLLLLFLHPNLNKDLLEPILTRNTQERKGILGNIPHHSHVDPWWRHQTPELILQSYWTIFC
jgi:hypothetical protein